MKKSAIVLALALFAAPFIVLAINVTVPTAPKSGYALVSTTTGAWIATTTDPFHVGSLYATSTATSTFNGGIKAPCFSVDGTNCLVTSSGGTVTSVTLATPNSTFSLSGTNPVTTSGTINADLNLANSNWWTALQHFPNATTSQLTATSTSWLLGITNFGSSQQSNFSASGVLSLGTALTVANGGTGAGTLTGCLTGNGTGAITGSGTCNTSAASVTSITGGLGLNGGTITTAGTLSLISYIATATAETATRIPFWTTTAGTPALLSGGSAGLTWASGTSILTATNASTTQLTVGTGLQIPNSTSPSITAPGYIAVNTSAASSSLNYNDGTAARHLFDLTDFGFTFINVPTNGQGTTTFSRAGGIRGLTLTSGSCFSQGGTANIQTGNGTASTTMLTSTVTVGGQTSTTLSSNNTFQALQPIFFAIGTFSSSGTTTVSCIYGRRNDY